MLVYRNAFNDKMMKTSDLEVNVVRTKWNKFFFTKDGLRNRTFTFTKFSELCN